VLGKHTVVITTFRAATVSEGDGSSTPGREELVPAAYNTQSDLTAEVQAGENTIDFDLDSSAQPSKPAPEPSGSSDA
jgi:hypothetical protein